MQPDYSQANRIMWNETAEVHARSRLAGLLESFRDPAFTTLDAVEQRYLSRPPSAPSRTCPRSRP